MRKEGDCLIIRLAPKRSLLDVLSQLSPLEEDFGHIADLMPEAVDL
jgi:hypothetical protein